MFNYAIILIQDDNALPITILVKLIDCLNFDLTINSTELFYGLLP